MWSLICYFRRGARVVRRRTPTEPYLTALYPTDSAWPSRPALGPSPVLLPGDLEHRRRGREGVEPPPSRSSAACAVTRRRSGILIYRVRGGGLRARTKCCSPPEQEPAGGRVEILGILPLIDRHFLRLALAKQATQQRPPVDVLVREDERVVHRHGQVLLPRP